MTAILLLGHSVGGGLVAAGDDDISSMLLHSVCHGTGQTTYTNQHNGSPFHRLIARLVLVEYLLKRIHSRSLQQMEPAPTSFLVHDQIRGAGPSRAGLH